MEKFYLAETGDLWYLRAVEAGFSLNLLLKTLPIENITSTGLLVDKQGSPHLFLQQGALLSYYYWQGSGWRPGAKLPSLETVRFYPAMGPDQKIHLLLQEKEGFYHLQLGQSQWFTAQLPLLTKGAKIIAFLNWESCLVMIYQLEDRDNCITRIAIYRNGSWGFRQEIQHKQQKLLNWYINEDLLLLLAGGEKIMGYVFNLYTLNLCESEPFDSFCLGIVDGCQSTPVLAKKDHCSYKLCWQNQGRIYLADLPQEHPSLRNLIESDLFTPSEAINIRGLPRLPSQIAFTLIYGTRLEFPLVLEFRTLEQMIRGKNCLNYRNTALRRPSRSTCSHLSRGVYGDNRAD